MAKKARKKPICCLLPLTCFLTLTGCHKAPEGKPIDVHPKVQLAKPAKRTITRSVGQPGFIYAYEQTSIYPKVSGYIDRWNVDIGDRIRKGQILAEIYVPELAAEYRQKQAQLALSKVQVRVFEQAVDVAKNNYAVASAKVQEAAEALNKYEAAVERWQSEVKRLAGVTQVVDEQVLAESRLQLKVETAARNSAKASLVAARAHELAQKSKLDKAKMDVEAARAKVPVEQAETERLAALVGYTHIQAPYDGIVVDRNANQGDYVKPGYGDLSAPPGSTDESANHGAPIYVLARTDKVRIYVDVPETDADYITLETKVKISIPSLHDEDIEAKATRTSWSLHTRSRTLRVEIDLPNPSSRLLPGMYAYGRVEIVRRDVQAVPLECVTEVGNRNVCYLYKDGKAMQTPVQTGLNDGKWIEVAAKQVNGNWIPFAANEQVIQGQLAELSNGEKVEIVQSAKQSGE